MKVGVLTVGSDAPGLNAALRGVVRAAVYRYRSDVFGVVQGFLGLLRPPEIWALSPNDVRGLVRRGGTLLGCNHGNPFDVDGADRSEEVLESVRWLGIDGLICMGGEGGLAIAERLHRQGVPVVCLPKTVENDVAGTSRTFGHATAVELATQAIDNLQATGESEHRVIYLEVLGRQAGWIALEAGVAGGADVVLIPEIPYDPDVIAGVIERRSKVGKPSTIIVVAEGAKEAGGGAPAPGPGVAVRVQARVAERTAEHNAMVTVLGHLQRGGDPNPRDRILATRFGALAVQAVHEGAFGHLVGLQGEEAVRVPLAEVVGQARTIDPAGNQVWTATSTGISFGIDTD
jgi:6-phosphofructokinase 1